MYSLPNLPNYPDQDKFKGEVMHAEGFSDGEQAKGKRVIVVGGGKSAIDCAVVAGKYGESSTLLFRSAHWPAARYLVNLVPLGWYTYSRFVNFTLPMHYDVTPFHKVMHKIGAPMKWVWWRIAEILFRI